MTTVLVTGATGALGKAVTEFLTNKDGYKVVTTSRKAGKADFQLNITDKPQLSKIIEQVEPDLILQLAATFTHDFEEAYAVNVEANRGLLDIVKDSAVDTRVLLIGSAAEYGAIKPDENPVSEAHNLNPVSVYGLTKAWQTQLSGLYSVQGVDVVVARVFNLIGDGMSDKLFIGRLYNQIDEVVSGNQTSIELGPLSASRDYISINDAIKQIMSIAESGESGSVYHVASGEAITMRKLLVNILDKFKIDISIVREADNKSNRTGYDIPVIYADITRTLQLTGK